MKNKIKSFILLLIVCGGIFGMVFILSKPYINGRVKLFLIDAILILISIRFRNFSKEKYGKNYFTFIQWFTLNVMIFLLTIGFIVYKK